MMAFSQVWPLNSRFQPLQPSLPLLRIRKAGVPLSPWVSSWSRSKPSCSMRQQSEKGLFLSQEKVHEGEPWLQGVEKVLLIVVCFDNSKGFVVWDLENEMWEEKIHSKWKDGTCGREEKWLCAGTQKKSEIQSSIVLEEVFSSEQHRAVATVRAHM